MKILSNFIKYITGVPRYFPETQWQKKSITSNCFRIWEMMAGRKIGIKIESSLYCSEDKYGNRIEYFIAYSKEAKIAFIENYIRVYFYSVFKKIKSIRVKVSFPKWDFSFFDDIFMVFIPDYALVGFQTIPKTNTHPQGFMFAIAIDTTKTATASGATSVTSSSMTITGSDIVLMVAVGDQGGGAADILSCQASFDSTPVSMTQVDSQSIISILSTALYGLYGAVTGTIKAARTSSGDRITINAASYSGVSSSTAIASLTKTKGTNAASTTFAGTLTTPVDNCWIVMAAYVHAGGGPATAGSGTTLRIEDTEVGYLFDSNAAITPAASTTLNVNCNGTYPNGYVMCAIEPVGAAAVYIPKIMMS